VHKIISLGFADLQNPFYIIRIVPIIDNRLPVIPLQYFLQMTSVFALPAQQVVNGIYTQANPIRTQVEEVPGLSFFQLVFVFLLGLRILFQGA
jgi:hypothetical protein